MEVAITYWSVSLRLKASMFSFVDIALLKKRHVFPGEIITDHAAPQIFSQRLKTLKMSFQKIIKLALAHGVGVNGGIGIAVCAVYSYQRLFALILKI